ncbi:MAG: SxtJ family membrane protein [Burkholderiaceae bacterium]|nr:SxtJ family membrane protein [Burkholderiaceae bacterium]
MGLSSGRQTELILPSNRSFGFLFSVVFAVVALWPLLFGEAIRAWAGVAAAVVAFVTMLIPNVLTPVNRAWMRFGVLLHRIVSPVVLAFMFFVVLTPFGFVMRALGRRPLELSRDASVDTYWVRREPPGPEPESIRNQF